jgi:hypothetical protein
MMGRGFLLMLCVAGLCGSAEAQCGVNPSPVGCTRLVGGRTYVIATPSYYPTTWSDSCGHVWRKVSPPRRAEYWRADPPAVAVPINNREY